MPDLFVRHVPEPLLRVLKSTAALRGEPVYAIVNRAVRAELERMGVEVPDEDDDDQ